MIGLSSGETWGVEAGEARYDGTDFELGMRVERGSGVMGLGWSPDVSGVRVVHMADSGSGYDPLRRVNDVVESFERHSL